MTDPATRQSILSWERDALFRLAQGPELFRHQRVHVLHRLDELFLEFLHHAAGGFYAVDQANTLSDKIADEVAGFWVACGGRAVDGVKRVAADDALQGHRKRAGAVGP